MMTPSQVARGGRPVARKVPRCSPPLCRPWTAAQCRSWRTGAGNRARNAKPTLFPAPFLAASCTRWLEIGPEIGPESARNLGRKKAGIWGKTGRRERRRGRVLMRPMLARSTTRYPLRSASEKILRPKKRPERPQSDCSDRGRLACRAGVVLASPSCRSGFLRNVHHRHPAARHAPTIYTRQSPPARVVNADVPALAECAAPARVTSATGNTDGQTARRP